MQTLLEQFKAVRRAGVPICAIETADPAACITTCKKALNGRAETDPLFQWDFVNALVGLNEVAANKVGDIGDAITTGNPSECLKMFCAAAMKQEKKGNDTFSFLQDAILFYHNGQRFADDPAVMQAIWNCRDVLKAAHATLVLLTPSFIPPSELKNDILIITEALPDVKEIAAIVDGICKDAGLDTAKIENREAVNDTLLGLSAFSAEQVFAMSVTPNGIDREGLFERKRKMIEQTPGLSVWTGGETFADLGGLANLKNFLTSVLKSGNTPVRAIGFIDEIEKGFAGSGGDTSGTSQDQLQVFLKVMQDLNIPGIILLGPPGTGKSAIAKATGNIAGAPTIAIDTGSMKASLVGESERRIRQALEVFRAVSQGKGLFIATCNKIASLPPELRRRFTLGTFYVDLPDADERAVIWKVCLNKFKLADKAIPSCDGWTGAEIKACCDVAFRTGWTLAEAAKFVVPVCKSAADQIEALRTLAAGRFISASKPGVYTKPQATTTAAGRTFQQD